MQELKEEEFGQKVDLTSRIREILINYPPGLSIIKELIQVGCPIVVVLECNR